MEAQTVSGSRLMLIVQTAALTVLLLVTLSGKGGKISASMFALFLYLLLPVCAQLP